MRIALFEPDIPQNSGNIFRLGACLGINIDIIEPTGYIFNDKRFRRSSMDYINFIKYKKHIDWQSFYDWSQKNKYRLVLISTKAKNNFIDFSFKKHDILVFGRESAGVPNYVHLAIKDKIKIPMKKNLRSINVSSAVSMVIGEACRQLKLF